MKLSVPARILVAVLLVGGCAISVHGLAGLDWPSCIPLTRDGITRLAAVLAACTASLRLLASMTGLSAWHGALVLTCGIAAFGGALWPLVWISACALSAVTIGDWMIRCLRWLPADRPTHMLVSLGLGAVLIGSAVELVASLPIHGPLLYAAAIIVPLIACRGRVAELAQSWWLGQRHAQRPARWPECTLASMGIVYVITSLFPELGFDSLVFHLAVPYDLSNHGFWHFDVTRMALALMPKHADWLYSMGFMLGGETGARMVNAGLILASASAIYWMTHRLAASRGHWCGLIASGLFLSMPVTYAEGSLLFVESAWTLFVLTALMIRLEESGDRPSPGAAVALFALLCGAVATKPQGIVSSAVLVVCVLPWFLRGIRRMRLSHVAWVLGLAVFVAALPYLRAWAMTGNPVFPFFNGIFKSDLHAHANFKDVWQAPVDWKLPYALTFDSGRFMEGFPGSAGFQWILLLPAATACAIAGRRRGALLLVVAGIALFAAMFAGSKYLRYVFPALALLMPVIGAGLSVMGPATFRLATALALGCMALNGLFLTAAGLKYSDFPVHIVGDSVARDGYVRARAPVRTAVSAINAIDASARPVAFFCQPAGAGLLGQPTYAAWYNGPFSAAIGRTRTADDVSRLLCGQGIDYIILDDRWGTAKQRATIVAISDPVAEVGPIQVRRLREELCLSTEVLSDTGFSEGGWSIEGNTAERCPDGGIVVSRSRPATQIVQAQPGVPYTLSIRAAGIGQPTPCRAQINWMDGDGRIVRADVEVFDAGTSGTRYVMRKRAPERAMSGIVYANSHDDRPVCIRSISLKWRHVDSGTIPSQVSVAEQPSGGEQSMRAH